MNRDCKDFIEIPAKANFKLNALKQFATFAMTELHIENETRDCVVYIGADDTKFYVVVKKVGDETA